MADVLAVIRSGSTDYDVQGRIRGALDIPLCGQGIAEAGLALYTSMSTCAVETGSLVGRAVGLRPRRVAHLGNLDQGLWQGLLVDDIRLRQPRLYRQWQDNPWAVSPPEGELLEDACVRVEAALETILQRHASGRIALVVPDPLDRIVAWVVAGESIGDLWSRDHGRPPVVDLPLATQWSPR
ncbi:MAG: histidine phosphatase family protein, partial [Planctomycetia bacterium]|nr:histidine phosphatase family protein [Planctomycetia bacterium]